MDMKSVLAISTFVTINGVVPNAFAFNTGDVLGFDGGVTECHAGIGVYPNCSYGAVVTSGSYFALDTNVNGTFSPTERVAISQGPSGGIIIGVTQPASGSHSGCPDGTENPGPDSPWCFFGNTGMHQTTTIPVTDNGDGTLNFTGWGINWNGIQNIPMGGDPANFPADTGKATIVCAHNPCQAGDTYTLDYTAHIPVGDPSNFGGVYYHLHLERNFGTDIQLIVQGGPIQECSQTGGTNVIINSTSSIPPQDTLGSITWSLDGSAVNGGSLINEFLSLGTHTIEATLTTTNGLTATDAINVQIKDTTKPVLSLGFLDKVNGQPITTLLGSHTNFVAIDMAATDICDPAPVVIQGALMPIMNVVSGDVIKVQGKNGDVELPVSAVRLTGTAVDASGNFASGQAILPVQK